MNDFRGGELELLADDDRPGGWLLLIDRIRQSYVDLEDPTYLDFPYIQGLAEVVDARPAGPLTVVHIGGGGCTFARYVAATRPGSEQLVLEPDRGLIALVRARLPFARGAEIEIRSEPGRPGLARLPAAAADVVVLDAFHGGRVPRDLTTVEFFTDVARVLRPNGLLLVNVADGPPLTYTRRLVAAIRRSLPEVLVRAESEVLRSNDFGNIIVAAGAPGALPVVEMVHAAERAMYPHLVLAGPELTTLVGLAEPLTDGHPMRSPVPPDDMWRVDGDL